MTLVLPKIEKNISTKDLLVSLDKRYRQLDAIIETKIKTAIAEMPQNDEKFTN